MRRIIVIFIVAIITTSLIYAEGVEGKLGERRTFKDTLGRVVQVPQEVKRIVALGPGALRLVVFLGASDKVVGVEHAEKEWSPSGRPYRMAHPELANLPTIGLGGPNPDPNAEGILKVKPDVILATYISPKQADELQYRTGISVVNLSYGALGNFNSEEIFQSLIIAGEVLDRKNRAGELGTYIRKSFEDLRRRTEGIPEKEKPRVYIGALGFKGGHGIESTECEFPPFMAVNARSVIVNCKGHRFVDKEFLLKVNPDIIFLDLGNISLVNQDFNKNRSFYRSLKAFKDEQIYGIFPFNYYTTNVETAIADAYFIGKVLYPERFSGVDCEKKTREIFQFFVGKDVYDAMKEKYGAIGKIKTSQW
jgi:iron complex transport system substrate-binding protein